MPGALNHNHLYYFWLAAKHRNVTHAARELGLAQPTVSAQIRALERQLGADLLVRSGRSIGLTEAGQIVFRHADEIFRVAAGIPNALLGRDTGEPHVLNIGASENVPQQIVRRILEPFLKDSSGVRLVCREWKIDELFAELGQFRLDLVLADRPHPDGARVRAVSHPVLETPMAIFAHPVLARQLRRGFPRSLHGASMYLPIRGSTFRSSLDRWFDANKIEPVVLAEFEDRELLKAFGSGGLAAFPAMSAIENEVRRQFGVERVGWVRGVRETYYAIAVRRRSTHPVVLRLFAHASRHLRGQD